MGDLKELVCEVGTFLGHVANHLPGLAAIGATYVAWRGLNTWKEQQSWGDDHRLGRDTLRALQLYRTRYVECYIELSSLNQSSQDFRITDAKGTLLQQMVTEIRARMSDLSSAGEEVRSLADEMGVFWGDNFETLVDDLCRMEADLQECYLLLLPNTGSGFLIRDDPDILSGSTVSVEGFQTELSKIRQSIRSQMKKKKT